MNVKTTFGAAGDGIHDDSNAFQAAFDRLGPAPSSPVLFVPAGTYRITRTLNLSARIFVSVIGEHPDTTIVRWDGPAGGVMLNLNGIVSSQVSRLTFDGNGTAAVALDQSWDGQSIYFDVHDQYADNVFRNVGIGLRAGHLGRGGADSVILRCRFLSNRVAGVSVENWNALNWYIRDSFFQNNRVGVTNTLGAGNFHVYNSVFMNSARADMEITNTEYFSVRNNVSVQSKYFFLANPIGSSPNPVTFQNNLVLDPTVQAISIGNAGPVMLLDNTIRSAPGQVAVTVVEGYTAYPSNANATSIGNTFTTANPYSVAGRLNTLDDNTVSLGAIRSTVPGPAATPTRGARTVYEVPSGATASAIQQVINTAIAQSNGSRPVVHLPAGTYFINQTLLIPSGSDVQLVGDGGYSALLWNGSGAGPVLQLTTGSHATLRDFRIHGNNQAKGILVNVNDQPGGQIFLDQAGLTITSQNNLLVEGLDHTLVTLQAFYNDSSQLSVRVVGGPLLASGQTAEGNVNILGGGDGDNQGTYSVDSGGRLLAEDVWYEGGPPGFANLSGSGSLTLNGANIYTEDPGHGGLGREIPPVALNNFSGNLALLNARIGRGGVMITGQGSPRVLAMGVDGPAGTPNYFQSYAAGAQTALLGSSLMSTVGGSSTVPDQTSNVGSVPAFMRSMLAPVRSASPYVVGAAAGNATDLRFSRVNVEQSTIGIHLKAAAPAVTPPVPLPVFMPVSVAVAAPASGQTVSGRTLVSALTSPDARVQFQVDGANIGPLLTAAPYSFNLDTTTFVNGAHTLVALASDTHGSSTFSAPVPFTVNNVVIPPPAPVTPVTPAQPGQPLLTGFVKSGARNNFGSWVGMQFTVGSAAVSVTALGRIYLDGNSGAHLLKLVRVSDGTDVPGSSVTLALAGGAPGQFKYASLLQAVTLAAGTSYYLVSQEVQGGDQWYDLQPVVPSPGGSINGPVYWDGFRWFPMPLTNMSYGPLNLLYTAGTGTLVGTVVGSAVGPVAGTVTITSPAANAMATDNSLVLAATATPSGGASVTSVQFTLDGQNVGAAVTSPPYTVTLNALQLSAGAHTLSAVSADSLGGSASAQPVPITISRSTASLVTGFNSTVVRRNYSGWVGMQMTVGARALTVSALGRMCLSGNTSNHQIKLVRASDGSDVSGGSTMLPLAGCTPGQFSYGQLTRPIVLLSNTTYYLVVSEVDGGDTWYDVGNVTYSPVVNVDGATYWSGSQWYSIPYPNTAYVPLDLIYAGVI